MASAVGGLFHAAYVPPERMVALRQYQYRGVDKSLVSNYIMQPYWTWLVTLFPRWMA
jgi:ethanolaminephosphotransferase